MFKHLKYKKNYKLLIGVIVGFLASSTIVFALYCSTASELSYDPSNTWLTSTTVQGALDELYMHKDCPVGKICFPKKTTLSLGDYVRYVPSSTSYTTDKTKTGANYTQTINPSELTLWRVIRINQDNTVDIISENVSSIDIDIPAVNGYKNLVGCLNLLAKQYENSAYTVGSRHFGYSNQTEYITSSTYFTSTAPWKCSTGMSCSPDPDNYEAYGGGDTGYVTDYNLVNSALGTRKAARVGTSSTISYWVASRYYSYSSTQHGWSNRYIDYNGSITNHQMSYYRNGYITNTYSMYPIRPIVTLKSTLSYSGAGSRDFPMEIQ